MRLPLVLAVCAAMLAVPALAVSDSTAAADPTHQVSVTGDGITTSPAFDSDVDRYAIRSAGVVTGVTVMATSSESGASVSVNGRPADADGTTAVDGLRPGDEVNVQIIDSSGTSNQSWILLPQGFPELIGTGPHTGLTDGGVMLTLASFVGSPFTAIVDEYGVPVLALPGDRSDFKASAADGENYSIAVPSAAGGSRIVEWDGQFHETRSHRLADRPSSTDSHDSVLLPDGGAVLMGYDFVDRDGTLYTDALIERQDAAGRPSFSWNSKDHVDEDTEGLVDRSAHDYAHINSLQQLDNGDILASFRNLSQVMLISGSDHGGHLAGDVIWRLGGLRNEFDFVDDPEGGPCAQHDAKILPNGHLMIFDNGSRRDDTGPIALQTADMCPDPSDPDGPRVARPHTRITEYALDTSTSPPRATLVWSYDPGGRYAPFAGNAQRLANGNTFAGWSQSEVPSGLPPIATEVAPDGTELWSLSGGGHFSYRAVKYPAADRIAPAVAITSPTDGETVGEGERLTVAFSCSDTGGSNLDACKGSRSQGADLSDVPGTHTVTVTATDRAGNATTDSVTYTVTAAPQPTPTPISTPTSPAAPSSGRADAAIRKPGRHWQGRGAYSVGAQTVSYRTRGGRKVIAYVELRNSGDAAARLTLTGRTSDRRVAGRWYAGGREVTDTVLAGTYRTPALAPDRSARLRLVVALPADAAPGQRVLRLSARASGTSSPDVLRVRLRVQ